VKGEKARMTLKKTRVIGAKSPVRSVFSTGDEAADDAGTGIVDRRVDAAIEVGDWVALWA
jgi:hypothetical protein